MGIKETFQTKKIIEELGIIDKSDLEGYLPKNLVRTSLSSLMQSGDLKQPIKGVYTYEQVPDILKLVSKLKGKNILGYHSALQHHGLAQSNFYVDYIISESNRPDLNFEEFKLKFVKSKVGIINNDLKYTDLEQTLLDSLNKIDYVGGIEEFIRSINELDLNLIDYPKLIKYLKMYNLSKLFNLIGLVFENLYLEKKEISNLPLETKTQIKKLLKKCRNLKRLKIVTFDQSNINKYKTIKKWNVKIPIEVKKHFHYVLEEN